jgi:hypothetical protein
VTDSNNNARGNYNGFDSFSQTEKQSGQIWNYDSMQTGGNSQLALLLWPTWSAIYANYLIINNSPYNKNCLHQWRIWTRLKKKILLLLKPSKNGQTNVKMPDEKFQYLPKIADR